MRREDIERKIRDLPIDVPSFVAEDVVTRRSVERYEIAGCGKKQFTLDETVNEVQADKLSRMPSYPFSWE